VALAGSRPSDRGGGHVLYPYAPSAGRLVAEVGPGRVGPDEVAQHGVARRTWTAENDTDKGEPDGVARAGRRAPDRVVRCVLDEHTPLVGEVGASRIRPDEVAQHGVPDRRRALDVDRVAVEPERVALARRGAPDRGAGGTVDQHASLAG